MARPREPSRLRLRSIKPARQSTSRQVPRYTVHYTVQPSCRSQKSRESRHAWTRPLMRARRATVAGFDRIPHTQQSAHIRYAHIRIPIRTGGCAEQDDSPLGLACGRARPNSATPHLSHSPLLTPLLHACDGLIGQSGCGASRSPAPEAWPCGPRLAPLPSHQPPQRFTPMTSSTDLGAISARAHQMESSKVNVTR